MTVLANVLFTIGMVFLMAGTVVNLGVALRWWS